jgi:hypothetical protein
MMEQVTEDTIQQAKPKRVWKDPDAQKEHLRKISAIANKKKAEIAEQKRLEKEKQTQQVKPRETPRVKSAPEKEPESDTESEPEEVIEVIRKVKTPKKNKVIKKKIIEISSSSSDSESDDEDLKNKLKMKYDTKYREKYQHKQPQAQQAQPKFADAVKDHYERNVKQMAWSSIFPNYQL